MLKLNACASKVWARVYCLTCTLAPATSMEKCQKENALLLYMVIIRMPIDVKMPPSRISFRIQYKVKDIDTWCALPNGSLKKGCKRMV